MTEAVRPVAVLFSTHLHSQRRRGGFHWISDNLRAQGWSVRFVTVDFSLLSLLNGDRRVAEGAWPVPQRLRREAPDLETAVLATLVHPVGSASGVAGRVLGRLTGFYPGLAGLRLPGLVKDADLVIFESNASLFFAPRVRRLSKARLVYRVSDNLVTIRPVPSLLEAERRAVAAVDVVSLASADLARRFEPGAPIRLHPMGIDKTLFRAEHPDPYPADGRVRVVCTGTSGLDAESFAAAAAVLPDWSFYLFGATPHRIDAPNVRMMGETPFRDLVPYVAHADIGFAPYRARAGVAYQADHSNRIIQYTYCRLPTVLPDVLCADDRAHFFGYRPADPVSIAEAFRRARAFDRDSVPADETWSWADLARALSRP